MGDLLTEHDLKKTKPEDDVALLARAQTLTVVGRLEARRKGDLVRFLYGAGLIREDDTIVNLIGADLRRVDLSRADLRGAILRGANLSGADFRRAGLNSASLRYADLTYADVSGAGLGGADLEGADLEGAILSGPTGKTYEELERQAASLQFATMPNGQKYEDWRKSKERRAEDGQWYGSS